MKKTKLVLKRQTVAKLTGQDLARVAGGIPLSDYRGCSGSCHTCDSCTVVQFGCSCESY